MSVTRVAEFLTKEQQFEHRVWWKLGRNGFINPTHARLLPEYLTPEQCADFDEYGLILFESERGDTKMMYSFGHSAGACLRPLIGGAQGIPWMLAVKLLWQADQAGVERTMGCEGAHLP